MAENVIRDVSDTALWVATYRAIEGKRKDALFQDPLADQLVGQRGYEIARKMTGSKYTRWSVVIRTCVIDGYLQEWVARHGIDLVLNLGAGLDTRPYRLNLPESLRWIEVDFPHLIELKNERLKDQKPRFQLKRIPLDLSDRAARQRLFADVASGAQRVLVLTEGVLPYLSIEQAASLAEDLKAQERFKAWITEYYSKHTLRFIRDPKRMRQMKNAPFQFFPDDWFGFFGKHGWREHETRYLGEAGVSLGREMPIPWFGKLMMKFATSERKKEFLKLMGYSLLEPT